MASYRRCIVDVVEGAFRNPTGRKLLHVSCNRNPFAESLGRDSEFQLDMEKRTLLKYLTDPASIWRVFQRSLISRGRS
jgi:hypothetical protein